MNIYMCVCARARAYARVRARVRAHAFVRVRAFVRACIFACSCARVCTRTCAVRLLHGKIQSPDPHRCLVVWTGTLLPVCGRTFPNLLESSRRLCAARARCISVCSSVCISIHMLEMITRLPPGPPTWGHSPTTMTIPEQRPTDDMPRPSMP